mmetsp:Transcript_41860/g.77496  ORF Transcript_41860/g.77496 Transcript_41860/m.77496 type:complete len:206 (+) Transcript_41860:284-901(+)
MRPRRREAIDVAVARSRLRGEDRRDRQSHRRGDVRTGRRREDARRSRESRGGQSHLHVRRADRRGGADAGRVRPGPLLRRGLRGFVLEAHVPSVRRRPPPRRPRRTRRPSALLLGPVGDLRPVQGQGHRRRERGSAEQPERGVQRGHVAGGGGGAGAEHAEAGDGGEDRDGERGAREGHGGEGFSHRHRGGGGGGAGTAVDSGNG